MSNDYVHFFNYASSHDPRETIFRSSKECHFEPFKCYCHSISIYGYVLLFEFYGALSYGKINGIFFVCHYFERTSCYNNITSQTFGMPYSTKPFLFLDWKRIFRCFLHQMFPPLNAACCLATMVFLWCFRRLWDQFICVIYFPVSQHRVLLWNCGCKRSCELALVEKFFFQELGILEKPKSRKTFSLSTCLSLSLSSILFV